MPQMSPLMWMNLFILFSMLYLMSNIKIYFSTVKTMKTENKLINKTEEKKMNWMW